MVQGFASALAVHLWELGMVGEACAFTRSTALSTQKALPAGSGESNTTFPNPAESQGNLSMAWTCSAGTWGDLWGGKEPWKKMKV